MQRVRLFENEALERLTLFSPAVFAVIWTLVLSLIVWAGWGAVEPLEGAGLFLAGVAFWTLFEYAMHRYLFHWSLNWRPVKWLVYLIHGNHHAVPNDRMRNLMPPIVSLPVASLIWAGCVELLGPPGTWLLLGYLAGYVAYDVVHYACHQWPMSGRLALAIKKHHMRHHHIDEDGNYAISAIFWDRIFGTRIVSPKR